MAVLSQSGAMGVVPYGLLRSGASACGMSHATGNDCDVTVSEFAAGGGGGPGGASCCSSTLRAFPIRSTSPRWPHRPRARTCRSSRSNRDVLRPVRRRRVRIPARSPMRTAWSMRSWSIMASGASRDTAGLVRCGRALPEGLEARGAAAGGDQQFGRGLRDGGGCRTAAGMGMPLARLPDETQAELRRILPSFATTPQPGRHHGRAADATAACSARSCR